MADNRFDSAHLPDFASALEFQRQVKKCDDVRAVVSLLAKFVAKYGFATVGLGHMINPGRHIPDPMTVFQLSNWPKEWSSYWANERLIMLDPVARFAKDRNEPFFWSEAFAHPKTRNRRVEKLMREFGFRDGLAIPMRVDGPPGVVSLGAEHLEVSERDVALIKLICFAAYSRIEELYGSFPYQSVVELTPQQTVILHYVAAGKTNWEIGKILRISEFSVRDHIKAACKRLNAKGRAHAVALAIMLGIIFP